VVIRQASVEPDFDRVATTQALSARLAQAEREYSATISDADAHALARERMVVLLGELSCASRRWSLVRIPSDPRPDARLDERLRRLTAATLDSVDEIDKARRLLAEINSNR
jgi:hypothetical protein